MRPPTIAAAALLLAACTLPPSRSPPAAPPADVPRAIAAAWTSPTPTPLALASWTDEAGAVRLVVATPDGLALRDGDSGTDLPVPPGRQVEAPSGLAVFGDHLFVAARDRVEVLSLPGLAPVGSIGEGLLAQPGALWVEEGGPDELRLLVTDAARARVARFRVQFDDDGRLKARADGGVATGPGPRRLAGDPADGRLLVADADGIRVHDAGEGAITRSLPAATGVALWTCPDGGGYWLLADAGGGVDLLDRATLAPRGRFRHAAGQPLGPLELHAAGSPRFPAGALYAASGNGIVAFDLNDIATALDLAVDCVQ